MHSAVKILPLDPSRVPSVRIEAWSVGLIRRDSYFAGISQSAVAARLL